MTNQIFVGVDVAKDWLDIYHASHGATRINNSPAAGLSRELGFGRRKVGRDLA